MSKEKDATEEVYNLLIDLGIIDENILVEKMTIEMEAQKPMTLNVKYRGEIGKYDNKKREG